MTNQPKSRRVSRHLAAAAALISTFAATPALAIPTTFAQFFQQNGALQSWSIATQGGMTTITDSAPVLFQFSGIAGLPFAGPERASFNLSATSTQIGNCGVDCATGDNFSQHGYTGSFSFIDTENAPGRNLLSGTFEVTNSPSDTGAQFRSTIGSSAGGFVASSNPSNLNQIVLTSDYLGFTGATGEAATFSLSSLTPAFNVQMISAGQAFPAAGPFTASGAGTFSADSPPVALVPEPGPLLLLASGLLGLVLVRRARNAAAPRLLSVA